MADCSGTSERIGHASREHALADLATRQHGVAASRQLRALGFGSSAIHDRKTAGRLHRVHYGVYAVGHPLLSVEGRFMAAVLACGPGAVLSHRSAAELHGLLSTARRHIDVTTPRRAGRTRPGIDAHSSTSLKPADSSVVSEIPCTTVARTLLDLAAVVPERTVERSCDQAEVLRTFDLSAVTAAVERAPRHPECPCSGQ